MDKKTIRVAEVCEWIRTPSGLLRPVNGYEHHQGAEVCEWIRKTSGLLRSVNG